MLFWGVGHRRTVYVRAEPEYGLVELVVRFICVTVALYVMVLVVIVGALGWCLYQLIKLGVPKCRSGWYGLRLFVRHFRPAERGLLRQSPGRHRLHRAP